MLVILDSIAYVEWLPGMDMREMLCHIERYTVEYLAGSIVHKFKLYMLEITTHELACTEILHRTRAEHRLLVARTERIESAENTQKFGHDL